MALTRIYATKKSSYLRRFLSAALGLGLALTVAGCSGESSSDASTPADSASASATPTVDPQVLDNLDEVNVSGEFSVQPEVSAPVPWKVETTMSKVVIQGEGKVLKSEDYVTMHYHGINARTGAVFDSSWVNGAAYTGQANQFITGFTNNIVGKQIGSRIVIAVTGADGYDSYGGISSAGIEVGDTLLFVVDLLDAQLDGPNGSAVDQVPELPQVSDNNGTPEIHIPAGAAQPAALVSQPLINGDSTITVADTSTITVNYVGMNWDTGEVFDSTYGSAPQTGTLSSLIEGWKQGLVGKTVGSRVLLVIPGSLGYPNGNNEVSPTLAPNQTLVYVVDILFVQATA